MPKTRMRFVCENCRKENWLNEEFDILKKQNVLIFCGKCGYVKGPIDKIEPIDETSSTLCCIPYTGLRECVHTTGPVGAGPISSDTLWGTPEGKNLDRLQYMIRYGFDPWTDWNHRTKVEENSSRISRYKR